MKTLKLMIAICMMASLFQKTIAGNPKFRYKVEAEFSSDNALIQYDAALKEYKVKYIFEQSSSK